MKLKKRSDEIQIELYPDGKLGIILSKEVGDKFSEVFKGQTINVFTSIAKKARQMVIEVTVAKRRDYISYGRGRRLRFSIDDTPTVD